MTVNVFLSYAHEDEAIKDRLGVHLGALQHDGIIDIWDDRQIRPGADWDQSIRTQLDAANVVVLLVSADSLASSYIRSVEMHRAIERHQLGEAAVIPIIVGPCLWRRAPFAKLQVLPRNGEPPLTRLPDQESELACIAEHIATAAERVRARSAETSQVIDPEPGVVPEESDPVQADPGANPYLGLQAFSERDAARFYGREALTASLVAQFWALADTPPETEPVRVFALLGPSGSGKSSLARAGLGASLLAGARPVRLVTLAPGAHPLESLARALHRSGLTPPGESAEEVESRLGEVGSAGDFDGLRRLADTALDATLDHLVILVDQFEEVYSLAESAPERAGFVGVLLNAAADRGGRVSVLLTMRTDFVGLTQRDPRLNRLLASQSRLVPAMSGSELRAAIAEPARVAGRPIDAATVERLVADTEGREGALPLLGFVLAQIWAGMAAGRVAGDVLDDAGGVGGALAQQAERLFAALPPTQQRIARRAFTDMVQLGEGASDTRRRVPVDSLVGHGDDPATVRMVLERFARPGQRLITLGAEADESPVAEVTHEALLDGWDRLRGWLDEGREDLRFRRRLDEAAQRWADREEDLPGLLWRPPDLDLLANYQARFGPDMTVAQVEFYEASELALQEEFRQQQEAEEAYRTMALAAEESRRELAEQTAREAEARASEAARVSRITRIAAVVLLCALIGAGVAAWMAVQGWDQADRQTAAAEKATEEATAARKDAETQAKLANDEQAKAEEAWQHAKEQTRQALIGGSLYLAELADEANDEARHTTALLYALAALPDSGSPPDRPLEPRVIPELYRAMLGLRERVVLAGHSGNVLGAIFSPDGASIVTASTDQTARMWDVATGQLRHELTGHRGPVLHAAFSPDGSRIVTASSDGTARVWDADKGQLRVELIGHREGVRHAAFSPDGSHIVTASSDGTARVWDAATGQLRRELAGHRDEVRHAVFSPDGSRIVTASSDATARVWDQATGDLHKDLVGHRGLVFQSAFSPDGTSIVTASADGMARVWDADTGELRHELTGHLASVRHAVFSPDSLWIVTASNDDTARLWDATTGQLRQELAGHRGPIVRASFSPDSAFIVTASSDDTARMWDAATGQLRQELTGHRNDVRHAVFSPDGARVVTASSDGTARVWGAGPGQLRQELAGHRGEVLHAVFGPDGTRIITASADGTARLWGAATGELRHELTGHLGNVRHAAFSPDGNLVVTASTDHTVRLWDAATGQLRHELSGHRGSVRQADFSPDGSRIVAVTFDHAAHVWDVVTGERRYSLLGHQGPVVHAVFSPAGTHIVTASYDRTARVWDAATGQLRQELAGHRSPVLHVAFSPNGAHAVTASYDGTARMWGRGYRPTSL